MANAIITQTDHTGLVIANSKPLDQHPAMVYLAGLTSANSRKNMQRHLNTIAHLLNVPENITIDNTGARNKKHDATFLNVSWEQLRYQHTTMIKTRLLQDYSEASVNVMLSALRGVIRTSWKLDLISAEDYHRAIDIENAKSQTLPAGRDVRPLEIKTLLDTCNLHDEHTIKDVRDAALVAVLYATGIRRAECASLQFADYSADNGKIEIKSGKGNKDRTVYVANKAKDLLDNWLAVRGAHQGDLWHSIDRHNNVSTDKGITSQAIYNMLKSRAENAGIDGFSPHDLRRTFAGNALDAGIDTVTVSKIMGHASPTTTARYDRRGERAKEQAAHKLDLPI